MKTIFIVACALVLAACASEKPYNSGNIVLSPGPAIIQSN